MSSGYQISHARLGIDRSDPDLVAGWEMQQRIAGQIDDVSGHGTNVSLSGSVMQESGLIANFLRFDGLTGKVSAEDIFDVSQDFTVGMWLAFNSVADGVFASQGSSSSDTPLWYFRLQSNRISTTVRDNIGTIFADVNTLTIEAGLWYYVVCQRDGSIIKTYVNGQVSAGQDISTLGLVTVDKFAVGCATRILDSSFSNASIAQVEVYSAAKNEQWVAEQYNRGRLALFQTKSVPTTGTISSGWIGESPFILKAGTADIQRYANGVDSITVVNAPSGDCRFYFPTAITLQTPEESARGFFSWSIYHTYDNNIYIQFIANNTDFLNASGHNGYSLTILSSGVIQLKRSDSGILTTLCETGAGTFPDSIFGTLSVSVDSDGLFIVYVDGVQVCSATDTTYTASAYQVFRLPITGKRLGLGDSHGNYSVVKRFLP